MLPNEALMQNIPNEGTPARYQVILRQPALVKATQHHN